MRRRRGPTLGALLALLTLGCGSRRASSDDAGPAVAPPEPAPVAKTKRFVPTAVVSPLDAPVEAGPERFAGFVLPRGFQVVHRDGTRVVLEGMRSFRPLRSYLDAQLVTQPTRASTSAVLFEHALPRGASADGQRLRVSAHTTSTTRVRLDLRLEANASSVPVGGSVQERLRSAGWGPNYQPPRQQNE